MFLTGPGGGARGDGRGRGGRASSAGPACTSATASAQFVAGVGRTRRPSWCASCSGYLPPELRDAAAGALAGAPPGCRPAAPVPASRAAVYDVRDVVRALVDGGRLLEVRRAGRATWSRAFARLDGRPVGVVANQPRHLGGVIDAEGARKGGGFVRRCDALRRAAGGARRHAGLPARAAARRPRG